MELSFVLILKIAAFLATVLVVLSTFSSLSWLVKLRIVASMLVGIILIGIFLWPLVEPYEPFGVVSIPKGLGVITLIALAFITGFVAYFPAWPYGREIGVLAVPTGLSVWAVSSGSIANLMQQSSTVVQRKAVFTSFLWEPVFWLAIIGVGFLGVLAAQMVSAKKVKSEKAEENPAPKAAKYSNAITAVIGSALIAFLFISIFAQEVKMYDGRLGRVVAQPAVGQIAFAVFFSFGIAAFLIKKLINAGYGWALTATGLVAIFGMRFYTGSDVLEHLAGNWPAVFFANAVSSILPVQMVAFGALGSMAGYWMVVRYEYWKQHERE